MAKREIKWSDDKVAMFLMLKNAQAAQCGKACPVAAKVLERIEAKMAQKAG